LHDAASLPMKHFAWTFSHLNVDHAETLLLAIRSSIGNQWFEKAEDSEQGDGS
jgi:hypothetical protein